MGYVVKEIFRSLQGEGAQAGRAAVFCRFSGCNLWNGNPSDRNRKCLFCDTDFVGTDGPGGGRYPDGPTLADAVERIWGTSDPSSRLVICTGGEPLLQLDQSLTDALHARGFLVAVETNGTLPVPRAVDWTCVSPKAQAKLVQRTGNEIKLVYPQEDLDPEDFLGLHFDHFFLQPMDGPSVSLNTRMAIKYCMEHPKWRLSIQMHKMVGIR